MAQENSKTHISATEIGVIKEHILEEPHRVFITVPEIAIKEEIFDEELPDIQDQAFSDEYASSDISTVIKEDADIVTTESSCRSLNTSSVVKEEFISEDVSTGNQTNMCFTSGTSTDVNGKIIVGCKNEVDWSKYSQSDAPQVFPLPQVLAQRNTTQKTNGRNFEYDVCNKTFIISASILSRHKLFHGGIKNFKCDECAKAFTTSSNLSRHKLNHSGIKKFECDVCNKDFTRFSSLSRHKLIHSDTRRYMCDLCNKDFTRFSSLSRHKLIHSDTRRYMCDLCNKAFTERTTLSTHKLTHSGIKRYKCDVCNKDFSRSGNLSQHKLSHSGIKRYKCDLCNKAYSHSGKLSKHKLVHNDVKKC